jgi:hypothetical protein
MSRSTPLISLLVAEPLYDGTQDVITEIPLDARVGSTYRFSSEITQYPVESGATITDHVHLRPDEISLEGMVSDTPVNELPTYLGLRGDRETRVSGSRSQGAFDALFVAWRDRLPLTVIAEYMIFDDMIVESFEIPKAPDRGEAIWFSMRLRKVVTVETLTAALPPEVVARLKRRREKTAAKRRANVKLDKYSSQKAAEAKTGKVSTTEAGAKSQTAAVAAAANFRS